jgi:hypothetical protein
LLLTPFHLWRIMSLTPAAIALALGDAAYAAAARSVRGASARAPWAASTAAAVAGVALLASTVRAAMSPSAEGLDSARLRGDAGRVLAIHCGDRDAPLVELPFDDLEALSRALRARLSRRTVVIGDACVNDLLPSLSSQTVLLTFRAPSEMVNHAACTLDQARQAFAAHLEATRPDEAPDAVERYLREHDVALVVSTGHGGWIERLAGEPGRLELLDEAGGLRLYRVLPQAGARRGTAPQPRVAIGEEPRVHPAAG